MTAVSCFEFGAETKNIAAFILQQFSINRQLGTATLLRTSEKWTKWSFKTVFHHGNQ